MSLALVKPDDLNLASKPLATIVSEHKARQARFKAAARRLKPRQADTRTIRLSHPERKLSKKEQYRLAVLQRRREREERDARWQEEQERQKRILRQLREKNMSYGKRVVLETAEKYQSVGVTVAKITSVSRLGIVVLARHEICWRLRTETGMSLPQIGQIVGGRDHSTALHGVRRYQRLYDLASGDGYEQLPVGFPRQLILRNQNMELPNGQRERV